MAELCYGCVCVCVLGGGGLHLTLTVAVFTRSPQSGFNAGWIQSRLGSTCRVGLVNADWERSHVSRVESRVGLSKSGLECGLQASCKRS